eukprot:scaffold48667_cov18-Tisochrysis_lutea.AAC.4
MTNKARLVCALIVKVVVPLSLFGARPQRSGQQAAEIIGPSGPGNKLLPPQAKVSSKQQTWALVQEMLVPQ